ncbi:hypothetical protein SS1G_10400 [Sclerotinia sclerotiorum 1980 UF-70]|uniref:Oxysterol binding protein n=1 Tax=Sclerotinia sclerotiorum (strain ATCC 18683 / 1980 / Ss-1) TaxID=665079 RepID=A7EYI4_SCLS1|nr:hypothetical protein SS1G_10400 [Sclerotinia sclerotiorum 1980 UF-70]EDN94526.1 hypothetical protein SS1G_10400 [Sclerotinia sclerotiorum 1980 UF-70]
MEKCKEEKIAPQHKSAWFGFIKSVATFKGDLSSLTAPPFLLSPQSIVEFPTYWAEHPSLFIAPTHSGSPEERALLVLKWFISTLKWQHSTRDENGKKKGMKPLNPFLGECFMGSWEDDGEGTGRTELVAEQVRQLQGTIAPQSYFSSTVHIERHGYSLLTFSQQNETHLITMPPIHLTGLMSGSLSPELSGTSYIRSSSGFTTRISYSSKGWISGTPNTFSAIIYKKSENTPIFKAEGQWSDKFNVKDMRSGENILQFDASSLKRKSIKVKPLEQQKEFESRRAWRHVTQAINESDIFKIGKKKGKIENEQREMRKKEKVEGREWERRFFVKRGRDEVAERLANGLEGLKLDSGAGMWKWDIDRYRAMDVGFKERMRLGDSKMDAAVNGMRGPLVAARWNSEVMV